MRLMPGGNAGSFPPTRHTNGASRIELPVAAAEVILDHEIDGTILPVCTLRTTSKFIDGLVFSVQNWNADATAHLIARAKRHVTFLTNVVSTSLCQIATRNPHRCYCRSRTNQSSRSLSPSSPIRLSAAILASGNNSDIQPVSPIAPQGRNTAIRKLTLPERLA